jgi:hypothetical protein
MAVLMALLTIGLSLAISSLSGFLTGKETIYLGGIVATFTVAFIATRANLASSPQCTVAAWVVALLCFAFAFWFEGVWETFLIPLSYLILGPAGTFGARVGRR